MILLIALKFALDIGSHCKEFYPEAICVRLLHPRKRLGFAITQNSRILLLFTYHDLF